MSKFFELIDFEAVEKEIYKALEEVAPGSSPSKTSFEYSSEEIEELFKKVEEEVKLIRQGMSKLTKSAIDIKGSTPFLVALNRFKQDPSPTLLSVFLSLVKQDMPHGVYSEFKSWTADLFEEKTDDA